MNSIRTVATVSDRRGFAHGRTAGIDHRYKKWGSLLALLGMLFIPGIVRAQVGIGSGGAPAQNWEMKIFTREGYLSMILRGSEVRVGAPDRYDAVDLNITVFTGKAESRVDKILLSPSASFFPKENRAAGKKSVRAINDDMEINGEDWTYLHTERKVSIRKDTRVIFHTHLPNLLQ